MVLFNCEKCDKTFNNPIICSNCQFTFCKNHLNEQNKCPSCKQNSNFYTNGWLLQAIKEYKNEEKMKKERLKKCTLCDYEGEKDSFWVHLIEEHKFEIINNYTRKGNINSTIKSDNNLNNDYEENIDFEEIKPSKSIEIDDLYKTNIVQTKKIFNSLTIKINDKINNSKIRNSLPNAYLNETYSSYKNKKRNTKRKNLSNNNNKKRENFNINMEKFNHIEYQKFPIKPEGELYYCKQKNDKIDCDCCHDHICCEGNCFCVDCMRLNINKFNLKNGQLINKSGYISIYEQGRYHCYRKNKIINENYIGEKFENKNNCSLQCPCNDCRVLCKFMEFYLPEYIYNRIKNN